MKCGEMDPIDSELKGMDIVRKSQKFIHSGDRGVNSWVLRFEVMIDGINVQWSPGHSLESFERRNNGKPFFWGEM